MTDQNEPGRGTARGRSRVGAALLHDRIAPNAPIAHWPGEPVQLNAGEVFVRYAPGPPDAESAVFVHGLGGSAVNWTDLMGALAHPSADWPGLAGIAPDLPGFGYSPVPPNGDYSVDSRSDVVTELIEHEGHAPVHLVGNSMGGAIATRIAARRPDLVETLTLISPALPDLSPRLLPLRLALVSTPGVGRVILNRMLQIPPEKRTDMSIGDLFADPSLMPPERRAQAVREVQRRDDLSYARQVLIESGRALVAEYIRRGPDTLWRDAAKVTAPTLVLYGSHDRLVNPATAARAARTFRSCRVVVLPRIGHVAMMERPDLVTAEMRDFIASVSGSSHEAIASPVND
jgi:pimeloyl-ACP methyl ester carboxylesterase